jgi:hypothetical protein
VRTERVDDPRPVEGPDWPIPRTDHPRFGDQHLALVREGGGRMVVARLGVRDGIPTHGDIGGHDASLPGQGQGPWILGQAIAAAGAESWASARGLRGDEAYRSASGAHPRRIRLVRRASADG